MIRQVAFVSSLTLQTHLAWRICLWITSTARFQALGMECHQHTSCWVNTPWWWNSLLPGISGRLSFYNYPAGGWSILVSATAKYQLVGSLSGQFSWVFDGSFRDCLVLSTYHQAHLYWQRLLRLIFCIPLSLLIVNFLNCFIVLYVFIIIFTLIPSFYHIHFLFYLRPDWFNSFVLIFKTLFLSFIRF